MNFCYLKFSNQCGGPRSALICIIFGEPDLAPHQNEMPDLGPHQSEKQDTDPHQIESWELWRLSLGIRIKIGQNLILSPEKEKMQKFHISLCKAGGFSWNLDVLFKGLR